MLKNFLFFLLFLASTFHIKAQCTLGVIFGSGTASATCTTVTASPSCHYIDEYAQFTGLTIGNTYEIGTNVPGTSSATTVTSGAHTMTLFDGSGNVLTFQDNPTNNLINITFTATTTTVRVQMNTSGCGTAGSYCHYYGLRCTSCPGPGAPACPTLSSPANNATGVSTLPTLSWSAATNASSYDVYLDADATCTITPTTLIANVTTTSYIITTPLNPTTSYRWMIVPKDCAGAAPASCTPWCFTTTVAPPANDNCTGTNGTPVSLTPQPNAASCTSPVSSTTVGATQSNTNCSSTATNDDVWFVFTANATIQNVRFENVSAVTGTVTAMGMDTYTTCGGTNANCNTSITLTAGAGQANLTGLTIGTQYFLRIWTAGTSNSATFNICIIDPPPAPANDECAGATAFTISPFNACAFSAVSTGGATQSTPNPSCTTTGNNDDIWFTITPTVTGAHTIRYNTLTPITGTASTVGYDLYTGSCGALTAVSGACNTGFGSGGSGIVFTPALTAGTLYYLRVWVGASGNSGSWNMCVEDPAPPPANDNCTGANGTPVSLTPQPFAASCTTPVSATTVGATQSNTNCSSTATNDDVWFVFTAASTIQTVRFENVSAVLGTVTAMGMDTYTTCGGTNANCTTTITLTSGAGQANLTGLVVGTQYFLRVWTNGASNVANFDICIINPPDMTYVSSTTTQVSGTSSAGSVDQQTIRIDVTVINPTNALSITSFTLNTNGTSVPADITNARIYYTGTSTTFSTSNLFGSFANPNGSFTINGSQTLTGGTSNTVNYFWLAYDLACSAAGPNLDGECNSFVIGGGSQTPTVQAPAGNRTITALTAYNTAANGAWNSPSTWLCGVPPNGTTIPININHNVTLDANVDVQSTVTVAASRTLAIGNNTLSIGNAGSGTQNLVTSGTTSIDASGVLNVGAATAVTTSNITVNSGGSLTNAGTINLGPSGGYNRTLSVTGTFSNTGTCNVNGNAVFNTNSTFTQTSGMLKIDGNSGTSGTSVASGLSLLRFGTSSTGITINCTGGTIQIVDPPFSGTGLAFGISIGSANVPTTTFLGSTTEFGDGTSTQSGSTSGFLFDTYVSTKNIPLGNVVVNGGSGSTRFVSGATSSGNASDIQGSLTVNSGSEIRSGSSAGIGVYGNIVNDGTISITSATSGVLFLGGRQIGSAPSASTPQTISGSGVWRNSTTTATARINSLTMNNGGGSTLQIPLTVGATLTLTTGKIFTDATNYLGVGTGILPSGTIGTGTVSGGSTSSHIVGPVLRAMPTSTTWTTITDQRGLFPVGDGTTYRPINMAVTTAVSTAGALSGQHIASDPGVPASSYADGGINIETTSPTGYWNVEYTNSAAGGVFNVQVNATGFTKRTSGAITDFPNIRLIKRATGDNWVAGADGTPVAPTALTAIVRNGCTTFSDFAVGGTATALPLELISFRGETLQRSNLIRWETAREENVANHIVERSADGFNWTEIGRKAGRLSSTAPVQYTLEDLNPLRSAYYRLRSVDVDGSESLSEAILLVRSDKGFGVTSLAPNPAQAQINVGFNAETESDVSVQVFDLEGRLVLQQQTVAVKGINLLPLRVDALDAGMYMLFITDGSQKSTPVRFVKQ